MVEYKNLDDVGQGYDLLQYNYKNAEILLTSCPGIHSIFMSGQSSVFFPPLFITLNLAIFS